MRKTNLRDITGSGSVATITTSYEGQYLGQIISAALLSGDTIDKGAITVKPNVAYKEVVKKLDTTGIISNATCDFTVTADQITLSERVLEVEPFQVNLQLCKKDFLSDYLALEMGASAYKTLPNSFADYIMAHVAAEVAQKTEQNIWGGVNATAGEFDGLTVLMTADNNVVDVPSVTATSFTSANIIDELGKLVDAIPAAAGANGVDNRGSLWYDNGGLTFEGIKVFKAPGMPADHMVAAEKSNLFFGTNLLSDLGSASAKLLDMQDLDGSDNVRIVLRFAAGVQYGVSQDIALYTLA